MNFHAIHPPKTATTNNRKPEPNPLAYAIATSNSSDRMYPIKTYAPAQTSEPNASKQRNLKNGAFEAPASGAATALRPGMNLETNNKLSPYLAKTFSVLRTQESGSSDTIQMK